MIRKGGRKFSLRKLKLCQYNIHCGFERSWEIKTQHVTKFFMFDSDCGERQKMKGERSDMQLAWLAGSQTGDSLLWACSPMWFAPKPFGYQVALRLHFWQKIKHSLQKSKRKRWSKAGQDNRWVINIPNMWDWRMKCNSSSHHMVLFHSKMWP